MHVVVDGHPLGVLQLGDHRPPQPRPAAGPPDPHAHRVQLVAAAADHLPVEAHQEAHLVRGAPPVLGGERVRRQGADAELDGAVDDVEQRRLAGLVALGPGQAALVGPPAVAVHHQRDVLGHQLGRDRRRPRAGRVRRRRHHLPRAPPPVARPQPAHAADIPRRRHRQPRRLRRLDHPPVVRHQRLEVCPPSPRHWRCGSRPANAPSAAGPRPAGIVSSRVDREEGHVGEQVLRGLDPVRLRPVDGADQLGLGDLAGDHAAVADELAAAPPTPSPPMTSFTRADVSR